MKNNPTPPFTLHGRLKFKIRSLLIFFYSMLFVSIRRILKGPLLPGWSWDLEVSTLFIKKQTLIGFRMKDIKDSREYEDSFLFRSPAFEQINIQAVSQPIKGAWYEPIGVKTERTLLYLHGGGYTYHSITHQNLISLVTLTAGSRTFALDYRLTPEHPYPAQIEDAMAAYRWLLETGVEPGKLLVAGDSAGGNLTLALLQSIREAGLPQPSGVVCICPWTDISNPGISMIENGKYDWVIKEMPEQWSKWFHQDTETKNPVISPVYADLKGLAPIYIQVGSAEILYSMICEFFSAANAKGADVKLDTWQNMTHDFQAFGDLIPESKEALSRIGEFARKQTS